METATEAQASRSLAPDGGEFVDIDRRHVWALNEWMRRYIEEPERFEAEIRTVDAFRKAEAEGREPDYGENCHDYLIKLMAEAPDA